MATRASIRTGTYCCSCALSMTADSIKMPGIDWQDFNARVRIRCFPVKGSGETPLETPLNYHLWLSPSLSAPAEERVRGEEAPPTVQSRRTMSNSLCSLQRFVP